MTNRSYDKRNNSNSQVGVVADNKKSNNIQHVEQGFLVSGNIGKPLHCII